MKSKGIEFIKYFREIVLHFDQRICEISFPNDNRSRKIDTKCMDKLKRK